jgi:hypothetical protein
VLCCSARAPLFVMQCSASARACCLCRKGESAQGRPATPVACTRRDACMPACLPQPASFAHIALTAIDPARIKQRSAFEV